MRQIYDGIDINGYNIDDLEAFRENLLLDIFKVVDEMNQIEHRTRDSRIFREKIDFSKQIIENDIRNLELSYIRYGKLVLKSRNSYTATLALRAS